MTTAVSGVALQLPGYAVPSWMKDLCLQDVVPVCVLPQLVSCAIGMLSGMAVDGCPAEHGTTMNWQGTLPGDASSPVVLLAFEAALCFHLLLIRML